MRHVNVIEGDEMSKKCTNVLFPNPALRHFRKPCGEFLLKSITVNGKKNLYQEKVCYKSIEESLQILVNREGFEDLCESWRYSNVPDEILMDVYDGNV